MAKKRRRKRQRASAAPAPAPAGPPEIKATSLPGYRLGWWHGEKFPGGLGAPAVFTTDYWTLRARSAEAFKTNHYARGIIRRFVQNVINTGLQLESAPEEVMLGYREGELADWTESIENRFRLWGSTPRLCDFHERRGWESMESGKTTP